MAGTSVTRVIPLTLGWEELPRWCSVHEGGDEVLREPVPAVLVEHTGGLLLLDTGFNTALLRDPALRARFYAAPFYKPHLPPGEGEPLLDALAAHGFAPEDVTEVAISHLHCDHAGGLKHFAGRVPVHIQRRELEYGLSGDPSVEKNVVYRIDFDDPRHDWRLLDGDAELLPGVTALDTAGHTPGHQSFAVETAGGGGFVFAFDAADLTAVIEEELPIGFGVGVAPVETVAPVRRLKAHAAARGLRLVPGHDPVAWPALTAELTHTEPPTR
ncbi:glyoxylase-like metal-dependent hydrolase (beta-lactamase superfamily II) [Actinocorallia herbida]|uniref:Glyoxylase-like metal-dependent hydrolase (Beta-lactamase superfamily II) n=1 Tax=Actinocorallia herbida TaxID=58109 RepID=A0A3N1D6I3_9ACTN|nr:N-acyl homoserine lactonase family protein [Actinocorallia herbida]ROO89124.1 glyoxylase-like metal-dependent hydrolase (beta-lactamase superfamily II) [Actinocorallia herbida]